MERAGDRVLSDAELKHIAKAVKSDSIRYDLWAWNWQFDDEGHAPSGSRIMGKKFIPPFAKSECGVFPFNERNPQYAEFIIRIDDEGKQVMSTCNADERRFLVPVYFRREVLQKYYAKPEMYSVEAGYIRCGGQWGIPRGISCCCCESLQTAISARFGDEILWTRLSGPGNF